MKNNIEFSYSTTNESPGYLLWTVHMFWQRKIKNELDKIGLTHTQFVLLSVLAMLSKSKGYYSTQILPIIVKLIG